MDQIEWLIYTKAGSYDYWYLPNATQWINQSGELPGELEQRYVRVRNKKQKEEALLLIALKLNKYEIEEILNAKTSDN